MKFKPVFAITCDLEPFRSLHPSAEDEAQVACVWYAARSPQAAGRFLHALAETIEISAAHRNRFPTFHLDTRRALLKRFPFLVVFRERNSRIEVIAVAHGRRRPGYWRKRLAK
jgi:toxin ParE1/3/4